MASSKESARAAIAAFDEGIEQGQAAIQAFFDEVMEHTRTTLEKKDLAQGNQLRAAAFFLRTEQERWKAFAHRLIQAQPGKVDETLRQRFEVAVRATVSKDLGAAAFDPPKSAQQLEDEKRKREAAEKAKRKSRNSKKAAQKKKKPARPKTGQAGVNVEVVKRSRPSQS